MPCAWSGSSGFPSSDGLSRRLFLERHGHRRVRREANPLPLDVGDQPEVDEMRVALVLALAAVALRSLMRPLKTPSTVPTWTPSAPITSMFWVILSALIWSLLWFHRLRWS